MNYPDYAKKNGIKLELTPHRGTSWKKYKGGKYFYFSHPLTKSGYEAAVQEWYLVKAKIDANRPNADLYLHHIELFKSVLSYWDAFGCDKSEQQLRNQVIDFVQSLNVCLESPTLPDRLQGLGLLPKYFASEFMPGDYSDLGMLSYKLPDKWQDRLDRMKKSDSERLPQTIGFWLDRYLSRIESNIDITIVEDTSENRRYTLSDFRKYADLQSHITTIDNDYFDAYHKELSGRDLSPVSMSQYFKSFRMFVRSISHEKGCDLVAPSKLESREFVFRTKKGKGRKRMQKKKLLWSSEDIEKAMTLPDEYKCFVLLMLNCGFRHVDIGNLEHGDLQLKQNRIVIQRNKLNQMDTAPVVNYKIWDVTVEAIKKTMSDDAEYVFRNSRGGSVEDSIKSWWKDNRETYGLSDRTLDYIRKTGSTLVDEYDDGLSDMYLGECLSTTAKIHYSFNDGDINDKLDRAIAYVGSKFGFCEAPAKTVELTREIIAGLKTLGIVV